MTTIKHRLAWLRVRVQELDFWQKRDFLQLDGWLIDGHPITHGEEWPSRSGVHLVSRGSCEIPTEWPLEDSYLELDVGGEGLVTLQFMGGTSESFGLDEHHRRFPLRGREFDVHAEVVARSAFGSPNRHPRLNSAAVLRIETSVERFARQIRLVAEVVETLPDHPASEGLLSAAERALLSLDWPSETETYVARIVGSLQMQEIWELPQGLPQRPPPLTEEQKSAVNRAAKTLAHDLEELKRLYPPQGSIALSGHAHIDLAWLWPMEETRRKLRRTFSSVLALLERYPEFRFNQSSAQIYAFVQEDDPDLFERICRKVAEGRWEPVGGMWVEPDTNMPTGEALVRQVLYGQLYFQQTFGAISELAWLPDTFGFSPALPQILRLGGFKSFFTIKLTWSETNRFPYDLFWWEGIDGSHILGHLFSNPSHGPSDTGGYNGNPTPFALLETWRSYRGKNAFPETLLTVGYGDGGGGPTREMLEQSRELGPFPLVPLATFERLSDFFDRMLDAVDRRAIPSWVGELYLELHRGTLTTQGRIKFLNRRAEADLIAAEVVSSLNRLLGGSPPASLEPRWRILLRNQFHDILPGSSIREVYEQAEKELQGVVESAKQVVSQAAQDVCARLVPIGDQAGLLLLNADASDRPVRCVISEEIDGAQTSDEGYIVSSPKMVPGFGGRLITSATPGSGLSVAPDSLENEWVRVLLHDDGTLASVYHKSAQREAVLERANQVWAYVDKPIAWDAWDIDTAYREQGVEILPSDPTQIIEAGPHRAAVRVVRRFRSSVITQDIRLWSNSTRLEFKTSIDWHERRWLVKALFPLAIRANHATFETAFGVVERPTHRNTSWDAARFEVVAHRFVDVSEPGFGVALLNDGKYGHHAFGSEIGITLLRSPVYPDPLADEGRQTFTYALLPHEGAWLEAGVLAEAVDLNRPLFAFPVKTHGQLRSHVEGDATEWRGLRLDGLTMGMGALKRGEAEGDLILRLYEPQGASGEVSINLPEGWRVAGEVDLLERDVEVDNPRLGPFAVRSWRLRTGSQS